MKGINKIEIHDIFQRIKNKEKDAIELLYNRYCNLVKNISFSISKDNEIAEEITQMVFFKIMQLPTEKIPSNNELSWLYSITKNQTIDYLRKKHNCIDIDSIYDIPDKDNKINEIINRETYNKMIDCLEDKEKEIVSLKVLTDFTFKEIGQILNMPTATIQWKYYKSIHTLKILLSNLTLFIITTLLYFKSKNEINEEKNGTSVTNTTKQDSHKSTDSISPSAIDSYTAESSISSTQSVLSINKVEASLFCFSTIFLIITIIFAIIFAKHQQKRRSKSSK